MIDFLNRIDISLFAFINSHHGTVVDNFFLVISQLGNGWIAVPLVAVIIIIATPRTYLARALLYAVIAGTLAGIANTQVKRLTHRSRPVVYFEKQAASRMENSGITTAVHVVGRSWRENSFPSGHAATAFAAAAILALLYGGYFSLGFVPALLVAYSRVYMGVHFPSDVLGGAVLGIAVALLVIIFFRQKEYLPGPARLRRNHAE
jgi:undecaprenyl-diphosphatase